MNKPIFEYDRDRAMKQTDFKPCVRCRKGMAHTGTPVFFRVTIEQMGVDGKAVERQHGLEMMLGGNAMIANVMGADEDMGLPIGPAKKGLLCFRCAYDMTVSFMELVEAMTEKEPEGL